MSTTAWTKDGNATTAYTEDWGLTSGEYDDSAVAYDSSGNTYDGVYFTAWVEDEDVLPA